MDHFQKLRGQIGRYLFLILLLGPVMISLFWWLALENWAIEPYLLLIGSLVAVTVLSLILASVAAGFVLQPLKLLWQAILHVSPDHTGTPAPDVDKVRVGRELLTSLTLQVYQFASHQDGKDLAAHRRDMVQAANIVSHLPVPLFVFNKDQLVTNASDATLDYCQLESAQLFGKPLFDSLNLEFLTEQTLEKWIADCQQNKVTDTAFWNHVRVVLPHDKQVRQCDMAAHYNRDNPSGTEFIVILFDRSEEYNEDDLSMSFVALAVHELRTPLTVLRGYIEVFEDELADKLDAEMTDFMHKMRASAQQLTAFVNNILNVSRVDENQLTLQLVEEKWPELLRESSANIELLAQVHGKAIEYQIAPDLPTVAVDRVSISEVVNNLLDNAIKYSGTTNKIVVATSLNKEGMVETTVQDFGVGIPESVIPNLFEKFYRNHRTRAQIGGTGLGLYLSKAIVSAHGGQIWVKSKEGQGATFGFTLQPFAELAEAMKTGNNKDIVRSAHGWIKNHSLYRR